MFWIRIHSDPDPTKNLNLDPDQEDPESGSGTLGKMIYKKCGEGENDIGYKVI